ncbi:MAG TPA: RecX family transcriptional regulator [Candidatus Dormibacteraeota bacterium]|nr:RecX family transcriptional regulator [Candidatus Dormibacteraeota bacterium]
MALAEDPDDAEAAFEKAVRVLNAAAQTSSGLGLKLRRAGFSAAAAAEAGRRAAALGYVNDAAYAEALVAKRLRQGRGRSLISRELGYRGLGDDVVTDAVGSVDAEQELESAIQLALKLIRRHGAEPDARRRDKVLSALARRGFSGHVSREALAGAGLRLSS